MWTEEHLPSRRHAFERPFTPVVWHCLALNLLDSSAVNWANVDTTYGISSTKIRRKHTGLSREAEMRVNHQEACRLPFLGLVTPQFQSNYRDAELEKILSWPTPHPLFWGFQTFLFMTHGKKYVLQCDPVIVYIHMWIYTYTHTHNFVCICVCSRGRK